MQTPVRNLTIIFFNCLPIAGVAFFNWSVFQVCWLFWMETLIIAIFNSVRILYSQGHDVNTAPTQQPLRYNVWASGRYLLAKIFVFLFYSIFIIVFIGFLAQKEENKLNIFGAIFLQDKFFNLALFISVCSQAYYILRYFFINGGYYYTNPRSYAAVFDGRQIVMHVAIVLGSFGGMFLLKYMPNSNVASIWVVSIFCVGKLFYELSSFQRNASYQVG